ncbi:replicative DNA helicase [Aeromonas dhakensis]|uniref:replicative DNA helicase n=1 Tax=Aeromonas dhakensis TaxID=196024 RepID=UPI003987DF9A
MEDFDVFAELGEAIDINGVTGDIAQLVIQSQNFEVDNDVVCVERERAVIINCIRSPENIDACNRAGIQSQDFKSELYRLVWRAFDELVAHQKSVDIIVVSNLVSSYGFDDALPRLTEEFKLNLVILDTNSIYDYSLEIKRQANASSIIELASRLINDVKENGPEVAGTYATDLISVGSVSSIGPKNAGDVLREVVDHLEYLNNLIPGQLTGVRSGIAKIDEQAGGFNPSDLIIVAARPGMGKTMFMASCIMNGLLFDEKYKIDKASFKPESTLAFTTEMVNKQLMMRMLANISHVNSTKFRTGGMDDCDWERVSNAMSQLIDQPLYMDDKGDLEIEYVEQVARRYVREHKVKAIWIDYLQRMSSRKKFFNKTEMLNYVTMRLKSLAKELGIPVIALAQVNRGVEQREDKRPLISDIKDCGNIEQEADEVYILYRDEYYNEDTEFKNMVELLKRKARHGSPFTENLHFIGQRNYIGSYGTQEATTNYF